MTEFQALRPFSHGSESTTLHRFRGKKYIVLRYFGIPL